MKKQQILETHPLDRHLEQFTDEHPLMQWIEKYSKFLLIGGLAVIALLFFIYRVSSNNTAKAEADYIEASQQFALFQNNDQLAFEKLQAILKRRPELHPKFDGLIAQTLINRNDAKAALPYSELIFGRVRNDNVPYYEDFAVITLAISEGEFQKALKLSQELKQKLLKDATASGSSRSFGDVLFAYNLLRIALLEQKLGNQENEKAAWSEWNSYANSSTNSAAIKASAFNQVNTLFSEGLLTLSQYIQTREKGQQ